LLLGHYQSAINAASKIRPDPKKPDSAAVLLSRDLFVYRAQIEQGNAALVVEEITKQSAPALQSVKLLAQLASGAFDVDQLLAAANDLATNAGNDGQLQTILGLVFLKLGKQEECLRCLHSTTSLEGRSILVQLYLVLNRVDLAARELTKMQAQKDDAIPTQLAAAWVALSHGREKAKEAAETFSELLEKYGPSVSILNSLAVARLHLGDFDGSEAALRQALVLDGKAAQTHINLIVCLEQGGKGGSDAVRKQLALLKSIAPEHPWVAALSRADERFDAEVARFEAEVRGQPAGV